MNWYWYVIGALGLAMLMVVHECGHFFVARACGMRVTRFSIGFGPPFFQIMPEHGYFWFTTAAGRIRLRLWKHIPEKHGHTVYQVAMIPFLAYVQIAGMNPLEEIDENDKGSYANASLIARVLTIFGGPAANYLFASVLFFSSFFFGGREVRTTDVRVIEGRPAAAATIQTGDRIVEINHVPVQEWEQMAEVISEHPNQAIPVVVQRGQERVSLTVTPSNEHGKGKIGVAAIGPVHKVPVGVKEASVLAFKAPAGVVKELVAGLSQWATGKAEGELTGPVGIVKETAKAAQLGWTYLLYLLGALSAYLGAFNLIPFPALDGGRLMFLGYEATTRRRPNAHIEARIHAIGLIMMIGLVAYVTVFKDLSSRQPAPASPDPGAPPATAAPSAAPPAGGK
jgi:regulator of sigma E protease